MLGFFFLNFAKKSNELPVTFEFMPTIYPYLKLTFSILIGIILSFQLPLFLVFLIHWEIIDYQNLIKKRSWILIFSLCLAALVTPPDVFSQIILTTYIIIFYEFAIIFLLIKKNYNKF